MKLGAHGVVVVASHCAYQRAILPVPYSYCLVIGRRENPGMLVVEKDGTDVVQVAVQSEQASSSLVRPYFDFVVIAARDKQRLSLVKVYASDRPIVLFESVY